jgi:hypothetical protein
MHKSVARMVLSALAVSLVAVGGMGAPKLAHAADIAISEVYAITTATTARISWTTSEASDSAVEYIVAGQTASPQTVVWTESVTSHSVDITGLASGAKYEFRVSSASLSGNVGTSDSMLFETSPEGTSGLPLATGTLVDENGTIYFIEGKTRTKIPFTNFDAFKGLGYNLKNVIKADVSNYRKSNSYMIQSKDEAHPYGSWVLYNKTIYYMAADNTAVGIPTWNTFLANGGGQSLIVPANAADIAVIQKSGSVPVLEMNDIRTR